MAQDPQMRLRLKIIVTLEDDINGTHMTVVGGRLLLQKTYTHQLLGFCIQLVSDMMQKVMRNFLEYHRSGRLPNEVYQFTYEELRQLSRNSGARRELRRVQDASSE